MLKLILIFGKDNNVMEAFSNTLLPINTYFKETFPGQDQHPDKQVELMDEFIGNPTFTKRTPLIILTHSEIMLARLQTRVAEGVINKEEVILYNVKGTTDKYTADTLEMTEQGHITNWPENFFGNMLEETCNCVIAGIEKTSTKKVKIKAVAKKTSSKESRKKQVIESKKTSKKKS